MIRPAYLLTTPLILFLLLLALPPQTEAATDTSYPRLTLWPLASHSASADNSTTDILWPLLHHQRRDTEQSWQLRPALLDYTTDSARDYRRFAALLSLARFERTGDDFWNHIFPSYWHGAKGDKSRWLHLWPLYGQWSSANGEEGKTTLWPFFVYHNNTTTGDWSANYFMPLGRNWHKGEASGGHLLPLLWWKNSPEQRAGFVIPYYWNLRREDQRYGIFPFWFSKVTPNTNFNQIALYFSYRSPERKINSLVPFWLRQIKEDSRFQFVLPFWLNYQTPYRSFTTIFPFYGSWDGISSRLRVLLPIHGSYHNEETDTSLWFPFHFHHRDSMLDSELNYYFPFYGHYRRGEQIDERYYLFPLYTHRVDIINDYESWNVLSPLFHYDQTGNDYQAWAMPFFWSKRSAEHRLSMALALYWMSERPDSGFTLFAPLYWHSYNEDGSQRHLFPFYNDIKRINGWRKRFYLGPLAILTDDQRSGLSQTDILWPLISRQRSPTKKHTRVLPFYWQEQTPTSRLTLASAALLPPYYVSYEKDKETIHHLWPLFGVYRDDDYHETSILWPLLRRGTSDDGQRSAWQVLLAYGDRDGKDYGYGLVPLWLHKKKDDQVDDMSLLHLYRAQGEDSREFAFLHIGHQEASLLHIEKNGEEHHQHLFPLYSYRRDKDEDKTNLSLIWPLFDYQRQGNERSSWRFLWRLLHSEKSAERKLFEFSPFFYRERSREDEVYTAYLGGLFTTLERSGVTERSLLGFLRW